MEQVLFKFGLTIFSGLMILLLIAIPFRFLGAWKWVDVLWKRFRQPAGGMDYAVLLMVTFTTGIIAENVSRRFFNSVNSCSNAVGGGPNCAMEPVIRTAVFFEPPSYVDSKQNSRSFASRYLAQPALVQEATHLQGGLDLTTGPDYAKWLNRCLESAARGLTKEHQAFALPVYYYAVNIVMEQDPVHRELLTIQDRYRFSRSTSMAALLCIPLCIPLCIGIFLWRRHSDQNSPRPQDATTPSERRDDPRPELGVLHLASFLAAYGLLFFASAEAFESEVKAHARRVFGYGLRPSVARTDAPASGVAERDTLASDTAAPDAPAPDTSATSTPASGTASHSDSSQPAVKSPISDRERFWLAIEDAATPLPHEISTSLTAVTPFDPRLQWKDDRVLVVSWVNKDFSPVDDFVASRGTGTPSHIKKDTWVTVVPDLEEFCKSLGGPLPARERRVRQLLGLPPTWAYTHFVEMWVDPEDLFRPSPDPEITDHESELEFPDASRLKVSSGHRTWFAEQRRSKYRIPGGVPWTRLGYTYDWGNPKSEIGLSEFVIRPGAGVYVKRIVTNINHLN
jgi:hypothetical protein